MKAKSENKKKKKKKTNIQLLHKTKVHFRKHNNSSVQKIYELSHAIAVIWRVIKIPSTKRKRKI